MRADAERGPTAFHLTDPAKTPLILRHDEDRAFIARFARVNCCIHQSGKVFLKCLLRLQIAFRMLGPRHHLAPAMPIDQAIDGPVIATRPHAWFKSSRFQHVQSSSPLANVWLKPGEVVSEEQIATQPRRWRVK